MSIDNYITISLLLHKQTNTTVEICTIYLRDMFQQVSIDHAKYISKNQLLIRQLAQPFKHCKLSLL